MKQGYNTTLHNSISDGYSQQYYKSKTSATIKYNSNVKFITFIDITFDKITLLTTNVHYNTCNA